MQFDPLSDAFVRIYNAEQAGHYEVSVSPASKLLERMLLIMQSSGYVGEFRRNQTQIFGKETRLR